MIVKRFTIATFFVLIFIFGGQISELAINSNSIMNASKEKTTDNITEDLTVFSEGESIEIYEQIKSSSSQGLPEDSYLLPNSPKLWTLLIYMCADCNLEDAAIEDINELEYAGGTDLNINVLVLIDRIEGYDDSNGDWTTAKLFRIESDSVIGGNIVSTELADYGEINMGNWHTLNYFLEYGVTNYPAESYALILWNHGDSAFNCCIDDTKGEATTIYDHTDPANNDYYLSLFDIRDACQACSDYINIIAFDCCLSSQAELAYVLSEVTDLMVASQKVIPNDGYDYYTILTDLKANIGWNAFGLGNCIVDSYENFYKLSESNSQLSLINLGVMRTTFIQQLKNLAHNLTDAMDIIPMNLYIARQSSYFTGRTMDIVDFCNILYDLVDDVDLKESLDIFRDYIENSLILNNYVHSLSSGRLHGLSIFMPRYRVSWESQINWYIYYASQNLMPMAYESDWDSFLTAYYDPLEDLPNAMPYYTDLNIAEKGFLDKQTQDHYYIYDVDTTGVYYLRTDVLWGDVDVVIGTYDTITGHMNKIAHSKLVNSAEGYIEEIRVHLYSGTKLFIHLYGNLDENKYITELSLCSLSPLEINQTVTGTGGTVGGIYDDDHELTLFKQTYNHYFSVQLNSNKGYLFNLANAKFADYDLYLYSPSMLPLKQVTVRGYGLPDLLIVNSSDLLSSYSSFIIGVIGYSGFGNFSLTLTEGALSTKTGLLGNSYLSFVVSAIFLSVSIFLLSTIFRNKR